MVKAGIYRNRRRMYFGLMCCFSFTTPAGTIIGVLIATLLDGMTLKIVSAIFQSFSAGTFLFVALEEIIPKELASGSDKGMKLFLGFLGFMGMCVHTTCFCCNNNLYLFFFRYV